MNLFLTGTDTGVGKTYVAALLVRALRKAGLDTVAMKPLCCGERDDAEALFDACEGAVPLNTINPVWYRTPVAPYTAAMIENRPADLALIRETFHALRANHRSVIVEGAGGWLVPIEQDYFISDLAAEFALPVAVVVKNQLGALNHTLLTVREIKRSGVPFAGYIFNHTKAADDAQPDPAVATNRAILEQLLGIPPLFEIEPGQKELVLGVA